MVKMIDSSSSPKFPRSKTVPFCLRSPGAGNWDDAFLLAGHDIKGLEAKLRDRHPLPLRPFSSFCLLLFPPDRISSLRPVLLTNQGRRVFTPGPHCVKTHPPGTFDLSLCVFFLQARICHTLLPVLHFLPQTLHQGFPPKFYPSNDPS